jgi:hypothetical protein
MRKTDVSRLKEAVVLGVFVVIVLLLTGCDYVPHEQYQIKTVDGEIVTLSCPVVDLHRSRFTYMVDGECVISK